MNWYVLRTFAGQEEKSQKLLQYLFKDMQFIFPKRRLSWRKKGAIIEVVKPLFGGYIFVFASEKHIKELDFWMRENKVGIRFVKFNKLIIPITSEEAQFIKQLLSNGDIVEKSEMVKIGEKLKIVSGPLVGLEGIVEKYSRRDRRVIIKVSINGEEKLVVLEGSWLETKKY